MNRARPTGELHQHRTAARVGGAMMCTGGALAVLLAAAGPGFVHGNIDPTLAVASIAVAVGLFGVLAPDRFPARLLSPCGLLATTLTAVSSVMTRTTTDGSEMLYLWTVLYCAYFLPVRQALLNVAFIGVVYPAVACSILGAPGVVPSVYVVGTSAVTLVIVAHLRHRLNTLLSATAAEARTDGLTDLPNRRHWNERLNQHLAPHADDGRPLAVLVIDVDHFKNLNDTHGHAAGDAALVSLGEVLRHHVRGTDTLARIGGEEFAVLMVDCTAEEALLRAEQIRAGVQRSAKGWTTPITISVGVALLPLHASNGAELLEAGDAALYAAKASGRNTVVMHHRAKAAQPPTADGRTSDVLNTTLPKR